MRPPSSVLWHAYCRWAALQGIEPDHIRRRWDPYETGGWPDGWLAGVPVLAERRGSAPATVEALVGLEQGKTDEPVTRSRGWHALGRTLPLALLGRPEAVDEWNRHARDVAALTHGDPAVHSAASLATLLARRCIAAGSIREGAERALSALGSAGGPGAGEDDRLAAALHEALAHPADPARLARLAPDRTAPSALLGGLYAAASFPERTDVTSALHFASGAPDGESVACVAGALLGAAHGVEALSVELVSRHELTWVLDTLARDLHSELTESPSGSEYTEGWDPHWRERYPGY
nr:MULTISPECIES: ADP-ribosylglycohydrolase family protein [unclassified Streptomyces]